MSDASKEKLILVHDSLTKIDMIMPDEKTKEMTELIDCIQAQIFRVFGVPQSILEGDFPTQTMHMIRDKTEKALLQLKEG